MMGISGKAMQRMLIVFVFAVLLFGSSTRVLASGMGVYVEQGTGSGNWDIQQRGTGWENRYSADTDHSAFGLIFDTNLSEDSVFNYRLSIGRDTFDSTLTDGGWQGKVNLKGIVIDNDFGFGVVRTEIVRIWLGPEIRLASYTGSLKGSPGSDIKLKGGGIGAVVGANFNIGSVVTLALKANYLLNSYSGDENVASGWGYEHKLKEKGLLGVQFGLIFRFGEQFM
jgi:hypothetical protein